MTAREFVTTLGPRGHQIEVLDPDPFCLARWSRWVRRVHQCPSAGRDPLGYLDVIHRLLDNDGYDVLLPTYEQALALLGRQRASRTARGPGRRRTVCVCPRAEQDRVRKTRHVFSESY
jgi:hypothetical protein